MNIKAKANRSKAFTIVEVIISMTIIGIAASGLMAAITGSFLVMRMARENQRATQVLMDRAEALRVFNWTEVTNGSLPSYFTDYFNPSITNAPEGVTYYGAITVTNVAFSGTTPAYGATHMRQINLSVTWNTKGIQRTRTFSTYVACDGMENYVY